MTTDFMYGLVLGLLVGTVVALDVIRQWRRAVDRMADLWRKDVEGMAATGRTSILQMAVAWEADVNRLARKPRTRPGARA